MAQPARTKEPKSMDRLAMEIMVALAKLRDEIRALTKEVSGGTSDA